MSISQDFEHDLRKTYAESKRQMRITDFKMQRLGSFMSGIVTGFGVYALVQLGLGAISPLWAFALPIYLGAAYINFPKVRSFEEWLDKETM